MYFLAVLAVIAAANVEMFQTRPVEKGMVRIVDVSGPQVMGGSEIPFVATGVGFQMTEDVSVKPLSEFKFSNQVHQAYDYSCGSAALATVLRFFINLDIEEKQVMDGMWEFGEQKKIVERRGFSLLDMKRFVTAIGLRSSGFKGQLKDLIALNQPVIVPIEYAGFKHFVVVRAVKDGHVYVADPSMGNLSFTEEQFVNHWDGNVMFVVYPKAGVTKVNLLELTDADMRVFDSDQIRKTVFNSMPQFNQERGRTDDFTYGGRFNYR